MCIITLCSTDPRSPPHHSAVPKSLPPSFPSPPPPTSPPYFHLGDYYHSPVAAVVDHDDILAASFTLPSARSYHPPTSCLKTQHYYKTHKPGTPMPVVATPKTPPIRQGFWRAPGAEEEEEEFVDAPTSSIQRGPRRTQQRRSGQYMRVHEDIIIN